jgi:hypothetical protein
MAKRKYNNIPVDEETYRLVGAEAKEMGFGERGYGAIVRVWALAATKKRGRKIVEPIPPMEPVVVELGANGQALPAIDDVA